MLEYEFPVIKIIEPKLLLNTLNLFIKEFDYRSKWITIPILLIIKYILPLLFKKIF